MHSRNGLWVLPSPGILDHRPPNACELCLSLGLRGLGREGFHVDPKTGEGSRAKASACAGAGLLGFTPSLGLGFRASGFDLERGRFRRGVQGFGFQ